MVGNNRLGDRRSDSVDLCCDTSTLDSDANVEVRELVLSEDENWFENLQSHNFRLDVLDRLSIDLNETPSLFSECNGGGRLFPGKVKSEIVISKTNFTKQDGCAHIVVIQ